VGGKVLSHLAGKVFGGCCYTHQYQQGAVAPCTSQTKYFSAVVKGRQPLVGIFSIIGVRGNE